MKKYLHIWVFLLITIAILPFFTKGYFFLLDGPLVTSIDVSWTSFLNSSFFFFLVLFRVFNLILPLWLIQRLFYLAVIFLLGYSGYTLLEGKTKLWAYFVGILLIFNPYVYAHILDGQVGVVASISMLVFFFHFLSRFFEQRSYKNLLIASIFGAFSMMWTPHTLFFVFWSLLLFFIADSIKTRRILCNLKYLVFASIVILLLNGNWILGNIFWNGSMIELIGQVSREHFQVFSTAAWDTNLYFNTLTLHGFWWESQGRYVSTYAHNLYWQILFLFLFFIISVGIYTRLRNAPENEKQRNYAFFVLWVIAYILALWISHGNIFTFITQFLYDHIPLYTGLREPQKWSWVLLIVYAYFGGYGVQYITSHPFITKGYPRAIAWILMLLPVLSTPTMLAGFYGQLFVVDYPKEWYDIREQFAQSGSVTPYENCTYKNEQKSLQCYQILSLPWHQYIGFGFARKIIANPTEWFFAPVKILQGDNMEIGDIYTQSIRPESRIVEKYIWPNGIWRDGISDSESSEFIRDMKWLGISEILLLKESDFGKYEEYLLQLEKIKKIETINDNARLRLFRIL